MKHLIATVLLLGFSSAAFATQTLNYTVPVGTVTHYKVTSVNQTNFFDVTISAEDGGKVGKSLQDAFLSGFKDIKITTESNVLETVREVRSDGTRLVEALFDTSTNIQASTVNIPQSHLKYTTSILYQADGQVQVQSVKYDRTSFPTSFTDEMLNDLEQVLKTTLNSTETKLYGQSFELNQPLFFEYKIENSAFGKTNANVKVSRTLTNVGEQGQLEFQTQSKIEAYKTTQDFSELLNMSAEYDFEATEIFSKERYLTDGRQEHTTTKSEGNYHFKTNLKIAEQKYTIIGNAKNALENNSDLIP